MAFMEFNTAVSRNHTPKVFIGGSISITQLDPDPLELLDVSIDDQAAVLIGDAPGIDRLVQLHLASRHARNITVFHVGNQPRNNVGHWPAHSVSTAHPFGTRAYFTAKDIAMARQANFGLMIWNGQSPGTSRNIEQLSAQDKPVFVFDTLKRDWSLLGLDGVPRGPGASVEFSLRDVIRAEQVAVEVAAIRCGESHGLLAHSYSHLWRLARNRPDMAAAIAAQWLALPDEYSRISGLSPERMLQLGNQLARLCQSPAHTGAPRGAQHGAGVSGQTPVETAPTGPFSTGRETARMRAVSRQATGLQR
jgi:hypothetical protein